MGDLKTKFVILTNPRTGSEYLVKLLQRHSSIFCLGEIFSEGPDGMVWNNSEFKKQQMPFEYLEDEFSKTDKKICGYKQISYWLGNSNFQKVKDFIVESFREGYKFIFITREDLLKGYVSFMIMMEQRYGHISNVSTEKKRIHINPQIAYMTLRKWISFNKKAKEVFEEFGISYLDLVYEMDFNEDKTVKQKVFDFLGVENESIDDPLKPTNPYPIEELVVNYDELNKYLISRNLFKMR